MSTAPVSPFVLVGDPSAAACEGDFCPVPEDLQRDAAPDGEETEPSPVGQAPAPDARS